MTDIVVGRMSARAKGTAAATGGDVERDDDPNCLRALFLTRFVVRVERVHRRARAAKFHVAMASSRPRARAETDDVCLISL